MANTNTQKSTAKKRIPVGDNRDILTVEGKEDGFVYRWVVDIDNRIQRFLDGGYEFVEHNVAVGVPSARQAQTDGKTVMKPTGGTTTSYLMRIKQEWYDEDQAVKAKRVDESEAAMKRKLNSGEDGQYGKVKF